MHVSVGAETMRLSPIGMGLSTLKSAILPAQSICVGERIERLLAFPGSQSRPGAPRVVLIDAVQLSPPGFGEPYAEVLLGTRWWK